MVEPRDGERMRRAEKEVAENLPKEMIGLDTEDVRDVHAEDADKTSDEGADKTT